MIRVIALVAAAAFAAFALLVKPRPGYRFDWYRACGIELVGYGECLRHQYNGYGWRCEYLETMPTCHGRAMR